MAAVAVVKKRVVLRNASASDGAAFPIFSCDDADPDADAKVLAAKVAALNDARARGIPDPTFTVNVSELGKGPGESVS